jgi:hypothetical protein
MKRLHKLNLSCLGMYVVLTLGMPAIAADTAPAAPGKAPAAKPATDLRTVHLRRRAECQKQADAQALNGEELKIFMQRCLQAPPVTPAK